jgi:hypothetical protein
MGIVPRGWELVVRLRSGDDSDAPVLLAVELSLLDEDGGVVTSNAQSTRPGLVRSTGVANARVCAYTEDDEDSARVVCAAARVKHGGPHPDEPPLPVSINANEGRMSAAGFSMLAGRATCSSSEWSGEITVMVAVRFAVEVEVTAGVAIRALDDMGLPVDSRTHLVPLDEDPASPKVYFGARTFGVAAVPARLVVTPGQKIDEPGLDFTQDVAF